MEVTNWISGVYMELSFVPLHWETDDEVDITLEIEKSLRGTRVEEA